MWASGIRHGLGGIVILLTAFLGYLVVSHVSSRAPSASITQSDVEQADADIHGFTYMQTQSGVVQWEVKAQHAQVHEAVHQAVLQDVRLSLYREQGRHMTLEADRGVIDTVTHDFDLTKQTGLMAVKFASGYTLYTNHLRWIDARREMSTQDPVMIRGKGLTITGTGLIGRLDEEEFKVLQDVRVEVEL